MPVFWHISPPESIAAIIEQFHLYGERQMQYGEKRAKGAMKKFALKTISKFYPKIEPLYQGVLHQNILETRLVREAMRRNSAHEVWEQTLYLN